MVLPVKLIIVNILLFGIQGSLMAQNQSCNNDLEKESQLRNDHFRQWSVGILSNVPIPVMARFTNTSTAAKSFNLNASRIAGDDSINFSNNIVVKITEIQN